MVRGQGAVRGLSSSAMKSPGVPCKLGKERSALLRRDPYEPKTIILQIHTNTVSVTSTSVWIPDLSHRSLSQRWDSTPTNSPAPDVEGQLSRIKQPRQAEEGNPPVCLMKQRLATGNECVGGLVRRKRVGASAFFRTELETPSR
eukprot:64301-Rhodomonas_salina.1